MRITKKHIGMDININGHYGIIVELFNNGSILVEYPNRRREVILKKFVDMIQ